MYGAAVVRCALTAFLLLACGTTGSSAPPARPMPPPPPSERSEPVAALGPTAPARVDRRSPCEALEARHRETLWQLPRLSASCMAAPYLSPAAPFSCEPSPRGAWALVASRAAAGKWDAAANEDCSIQYPSLLLDLVFRFESGEELAFAGLTESMDTWGGTKTTLDAVFDYDADGLPEAVVCVAVDGEGTYNQQCDVHSVRAGAVVPYAPAAAFQPYRVEDIDGDGRPDLFFAAHEAETSLLGVAGSSANFIGVAHSLADGSFSDDDAIVTAYYRSECSKRPRPIVARSGKLRDDEATGKNIVCARAWGESIGGVRAELEQACRGWSSDLGIVNDPRAAPLSQPCPSWWLEWLRQAKDHGVR